MTATASAQGSGARYALFDEIAAGGMASVHLGRAVTARGLGPIVAIKKLFPQFAKDPEFVAMFLDEAHLAAHIKHPNVVATLDVVNEGGELLLVMEYVAGDTFSRVQKGVRALGERLDPRVACAVVARTLHGLHAAHDAQNEFGEPLGIVHRDVSPQNILVGVDGVARVMDFGVAKAAGKLHQTRGHQLKGKLPYMSPEQLRGGPVTRAADVWATSVVLWEALTGERLFAGENDAVVMQRVMTAPVPDVTSRAPDLPRALDAICKQGLSRSPSERFASAKAMAIALEEAFPLAPAPEVGALVERVCAAALARRAERVGELLSKSPSGPALVSSAEFIADALWGGKGTGPDPGVAAGTGAATIPAPLPSPGRAPGASGGAPAGPAPGPDASLATGPTMAAVGPAVAVPPEAARTARPVEPRKPEEIARAVSVRPAAAAPPAPRRTRLGWVALAAAPLLLSGLALLLAPLLIPRYARDQAVALAASRGITLQIHAASGGLSGLSFRGVQATVPDVPGVTVEIDEVQVDLSWFRPTRARLNGVSVAASGEVGRTLALAALWYRSHRDARSEAASEAEGLRIDVPSARLAWDGAWDGGRIEADAISGEIGAKSSSRLGDELRFATSKLTLKKGDTAIGPWRVEVEQDAASTTARVAFDPPVPDGPRAILTQMVTGKTELDVTVPRSPLTRLGVAPAALTAMRRPPDQVELTLHFVRSVDHRVDAKLSAAFYGMGTASLPGPFDVRLAGAVAGDAQSALDLSGGTLSVGPMSASLSGPVTVRPGGFAANLAWKAAAIPCARFLPEQGQAAGDLAAQLGALGTGQADLASLGLDVTALARAAGIARVSGSLAASGTLSFDSSDPLNPVFTATAKNSCGVALFGGP